MEPSPDFEPQTRARSNTWPLPQCDPSEVKPGGGGPGQVPAKKNSSRRNAWGNLSYADLITQAIGSSPDKRLTLSQIYEWMVHNVAYFKDKGDSNSSAGWKNSIRHNLSLHNRFVRMQNEGTGKSSWWMLNPDAKPGKSARRRATSMETPKFEKRRGRVKKNVDLMRKAAAEAAAVASATATTATATTSPSSSISESLDLFPESPLPGFQLSPDFRPRTSSNASSTGGRLSPIPASEGEWLAYYGPEQLAGNLATTMRLGQEASGFAFPPPPPPYRPPPYTSAHHCPVHRQPLPCTTCAVLPKHEDRGGFVRGGDLPTEGIVATTTMMGHLMGALNNPSSQCTALDDVNLNIEALPIHGGFDCNVEEVIKHELSLDGSLEFNFNQQQAPDQQPFSGHSGHSWVH